MFADVGRHQQPHQFLHSFQSPSQHETSYVFGPNATFDTLPQLHRKVQHRPSSPQSSGFQKPLPYAYPLKSPASRQGRTAFLDARTSGADTSEHMLRRKTPNGTLAAGYDGTPVEWNRPHVNKHVIMPTSNAGEDDMDYKLPFDGFIEQKYVKPLLNSPGDEAVPFHNWRQGPLPLQHRYGPGLAMDGESASNTWRQNGAQAPSLDSVLHQAPAASHFFNMGGYQQVPTALHPMWPPSMGPTSSNAPGPYGPYWPNGSFEPYRPAALRDPRFHAQFANFSINDSSDSRSKHLDRAEWTPDILSSPYTKNGDDNGQWSIHGQNVHSMDTTPLQQDSCNAQVSDLEALRHEIDQVPTTQLTYRRGPAPLRYSSMPQDDDLTWSSLHSPTQSLTPTSADGLRHSNQLQFKEKVLVWAHRIYINLLASIHQSRKQSLSRQHSSQANFFPKPPRHPDSMSQTISDMIRKDGQSAEIYQDRDRVVYHEQSSDIVDRAKRLAHSTDSQWAYRRHNVTLPDPNVRGVRPSAHPQSHSSHLYSEDRHYSGYAIPIFDHDSQIHRPAMDAKAALEMLARLSQESGWQWTDGLLLGGCLAYGLGDYDKALQWYRKVLELDSK